MNRRNWMIAALAGGAIAATGCQKDSGAGAADFQKQRQDIVAEQRRTPPAAAQTGQTAGEGAVAEAEAPAPVSAYSYEPLGKRDPFRSYVLDRLKEVEVSSKGPLEQFELQQLSVLGVVWETNNRRALVSDPSGQAYIVSLGDAIGKNDGRVIDIEDNLVLVRETYVDYVGDKTTKEIEMRVRPGQGG
jgi:type IV pilus assembly protein PilP